MFLYWLLSSLHMFFPPFSLSCHSICSAMIPYSTAMWYVYFLLFLVNSTYWFFLLCLCNLYVFFQILIRNSGILLGHSVPSLSSILPTPLKTFCCAQTSLFYFIVSLVSWVPMILPPRKMKSASLSHTYAHLLILYQLLFSLSDTHSCSFLWQDCSYRSSSVTRLFI